jgi:glycerate kinase
VLDTVGFDELLDGADIVFTGEGKIDSQSIEGKVVSGVAKRAKEKDVPVIAIVGGADGDLSSLYDIGINSVFTINRLPEDFSVSRYKSEENLSKTADNILRLLSFFEN